MGWLDAGATEPDVLSFEAVGGRTAYLAIAGDSFPGLIGNYTDVTGRQPMPPRWALGHHQCRWSYMDETEVTNVMYLEYLDYIKSVYPPEDPKYTDIYIGALPDTLVWRNRLGYNETMTNNYLRHPAYAEYPVVGVNWVQATQFAEWRTDRVNEAMLEREGYLAEDVKYRAMNGEIGGAFSTESYLNNPKSVYGGQIDTLVGKKQKDSVPTFAKRSSGVIMPAYRLPTETEWEYAARAGSSEARYWDRDIDCSRAVYENNPAKGQDSCVAYLLSRGLDSGSTAPVGSYPANAFGLHDMLGNVWEWCADFYGSDYYSRSPKDNPQGPAGGTTRVFRGGSWYWKPSSLRAAHRGVVDGLPQDYKGNGLGFRVVRTALY
mgnify:CR=1 FL=1